MRGILPAEDLPDFLTVTGPNSGRRRVTARLAQVREEAGLEPASSFFVQSAVTRAYTSDADDAADTVKVAGRRGRASVRGASSSRSAG
jgi:hypothetical protein